MKAICLSGRLLTLLCLAPTLVSAQEPAISTSQTVDLGLSVKWAGWNLGASSPEDYGGQYSWGDNTGNKTPDELNRILTDTLPKTISGFVYVDCARNLWREDWRIPSFYEMTELVLKCEWTPYTYKGVKGYRVTGPNGKSIFLPLTGATGGARGNTGNYWTGRSNPDRKKTAYNLFFDCIKGPQFWGNLHQLNVGADINLRLSVRPVRGVRHTSDKYYAKACRMIGEFLKTQGMDGNAVVWFEKAKRYDPYYESNKRFMEYWFGTE